MGKKSWEKVLLIDGSTAMPLTFKKFTRSSKVDQAYASSFALLPSEHRLFQSATRQSRAQCLPEPRTLDIKDTQHIYGSHAFATFQCNQTIEIPLLGKILAEKTKEAGATIVGEGFLPTENGGLTGGFVIAESHVITHVMPLPNSTFAVMIDAYTCGNKLDPTAIINAVFEELNKHLPLEAIEKIDFKRGIFAKKPNTKDLEETHSFIPGIAHRNGSQLTFFKEASARKPRENCTILGRHVVGELYAATPVITNNGKRLFQAIVDALTTKDLDHLLFWHIIKFTPQGVSIVLMGPGIHITTHPWPELSDNMLPIDIFVTEESEIDPVAFMHRFAKETQAQKYKVYEFDRGVHVDGKLHPVLQEYVPTSAKL